MDIALKIVAINVMTVQRLLLCRPFTRFEFRQMLRNQERNSSEFLVGI